MSVELIPTARHPEYSIHFSNEDREWVATSSAYPSLSWLAPTRKEALAGLDKLIASVEEDLSREGKVAYRQLVREHDEREEA